MNTARHGTPRHGNFPSTSSSTSTSIELLEDAPEQLNLLAPTQVPLQFRLDQRTRQRGLAHIAAIKAQLAAKAEAREAVATRRAA